MTLLDVHKLIRLRSDLGEKTSIVRSLIESFEADVYALTDAVAVPPLERANIIHQVTGSAAMLAPMHLVGRLNRLEDALRNGSFDVLEFDAIVDTLNATVGALMEWIETVPLDDETIPNSD